LRKSIHLKQSGAKSFLRNDLLQMDIVSQTFQALGISPLNTLKKLEKHQPDGMRLQMISGASSPVHR